MRIGAHLSIAKGLDKAIDMALEIGANTFQFFTRNPRGGGTRTISHDEIVLFRQAKAQHNLKDIVGHLPYTVNLATPKEDLFTFACRILGDDLRRFSEVGVEFLVTHPGSHLGTGESEGLKRLATAIDRVFTDYDGTTVLLLETMSGRGSELGGQLTHFECVLNTVKYPERLGICLDSCHLFAGGYDLRTREGVDALVEELQATVGFQRVKMIHINDSAYPCGSKQDRHANIDQGEMGLEAFANLLQVPEVVALPWLLETPQDRYLGYAEEIELLTRLREQMDRDGL